MTVNADRPRTWRMSFSMTPTQIVDGSKTVTRRHADTWRTILVPLRGGRMTRRHAARQAIQGIRERPVQRYRKAGRPR